MLLEILGWEHLDTGLNDIWIFFAMGTGIATVFLLVTLRNHEKDRKVIAAMTSVTLFLIVGTLFGEPFVMLIFEIIRWVGITLFVISVIVALVWGLKITIFGNHEPTIKEKSPKDIDDGR